MDYDDNDAQDQNLHLVGEASDKVSPAYNLPKFDFDDSLQGHLRFDNLVDNDVFLGITGQDDNQWIEEYSRGTSAIQFSSSAVELKSKNVWSEATSSESVEMLLKSVGQEDKVLEETIVEELDACDRPNNVTNDMDPSLKQCDTKDNSINTDNAVVPDESHENSVASKVSSDCEQSQETQNSGGGLDSVVIGSKNDSSLGVEEVDNLQNDVNLDAGKIANESLVIEVQEEPSVSNAGCGDAGSSDNLVASVKDCEENRQEVPESGSENAGGQSKDVDNNMENTVENSTISGTVVETCTYSIDQVSTVPNVESLDKPSIEDTIHVDEEPIVSLPSESSDMQIDDGPGKENNVNMQEELPAASPNGGCVEMQATEDANRKSEIPDEGPDKELNDNMQEESLASTNTGCVDVQATDHANTNAETPDEGTGNELNMQEELLPASPNGGCVNMQATEDADRKSEMPNSPISNLGSQVQSHSVETENVVGGDGQNVISGTALVEGSGIKNVGTTSIAAGSSAEMPAEDLSKNASKVQTEDISNVGSHARSHSVETENVVGGDDQNVTSGTSLADGSDTNNVCTTSIVAGSSAEMPAEDFSNNDSKVQTEYTNNVGFDVQSYSLETTNVVAQDGEHVTSGTSLVEGSDIDNVGTTSIAAGTSAERSVEDISHNASEVQTEDTNNEDLSLPAKVSGLVEVDDETQSSEPDGVAMDQDVTLNEGRDAKLPSDFRDMDVDDAGAPDSQKDVDAQQSDSNMAAITDAVAAVESSKLSSPDTVGGVQTPTGIVATDDNEDQPRSPILGVSFVHADNKEKVVAGLSDEGSSPKAIPEADGTTDIVLDDPLPVAEKGVESDGAEHVVHELSGHCDPPVENLNASISEQTAEEPPVGNLNASSREQTSEGDPGGLKCSNALETTLPCDLSVEQGNKEEGGPLDPKESKSSEHGVESRGVNVSDKQQVSVDIAVPSACDTNHVVQNGGGSLLDKPQSLSSELPQSAKDTIEVTKGTINENAPLTSVATTEEKSFTFEVSASPVPGQTGTQNLGLSKVSSANLHKDYLVSPQTPSSAANEAGAKGNSVPKPRRKSAARETAKKDNHLKEKTPRRRAGAVDKSPAGHVKSPSGHVIRIEETKESVKSSSSKSAGAPISTSNLPDLNNLTSQFQQSFTDNQQVQLRAQILVYGSLISGMAPEESHMLAAFGKSDGGKKAWEAAWHACLERVRGQKSQTPNPSTPMKSPSGNKDPVGSAQCKVVSGISSSIVSPMIPVSSPLWNISTLGDYRQTPSPLHPYRTPPVQNVAGNNPAWLSQGPFPGQWVAASPIAPFSARFSALPITEAIKLTTVKESGASGTSVIPVDPSPGPLVATNQPSSDSKSRKRKKVTASQAQVTPPSAPVAHLLQAPRTEDHNKNLFLTQSQTNLGTALVVSSHSPTSAAVLSTPVSIVSKSNLGHPSGIDQSIVRREENVSKIEESKLQAADAALQAADAVSHCQGVWSQLERQKNSGLVSDDEAKLASSAVSIAAAASVAKVAAAAARIASNVAEQSRLMADEVFLSSRIESHGQSGIISHDKAMSTDNPSSIISAAREAARRRIEAASAASKHAENLDAIVKAAELAAEAVSQAGKIVAMGNPMSLKALVEAGPEGYWKSPQSSNQQSSDKQIVEVASNNKEHQSLKHGSTLQEDSGNLAKSQMMIIDSISGSTTSNKNDKSTARGQKGPELAKTVALVPEPESGSVRTSDVDQNMPQSTSGSSQENAIKEGCLVEVYKNDHKNNGAWFAANVLALKDGKAFVCYTEIQVDQGGQYKEWVPLDVDNTQAPRIRIAHPLTTMKPEGTRKRGRTALADSWFSGDRVDVWVQNRWCEAVVLETNKIDLTSLTVKFPANGETSIVRSWHVRPAHIWKDGKWIEWSSLKGCRSSEDDAPLEKRQKFGSPIVEGREKDTFSISVDLVGPRQQESQILPFAAQESSFDIGKSSRNEDKIDSRRAMKSNLKKERSRVVFGVPKPGKKQKFMDVRTQYVADRSTKNDTSNDSVNFASSMIPQPGRRTPKSNLKDNGEEKQVEVKSKTLKPRKPPVPSVRSLAQKDRSKSSKSTSRDAISANENFSSNTEDAKGTSSKAGSQRSNKAITTPGDRKAMKVEVKEQPTSEVEIRRSNRKIQPTSRMLEGLQSSLTVSKIPSASHTSQRSHNKVTSKGGSNPS
ncbi:Agenet-like domain-containing protein [Artemisia annua]|uniref:Agenet-like domain-containing protein n=1 Tax=Artemisia annua TaxID=35608 RepID=A0A2U1M7G7_ARTAN|nr:Agenet-like domain-containing protein [Artemisia annua]